MATSTNTTTCPACDCDDSPLSVVANVLGILTFALGLLAAIGAFAAVTRGAKIGLADTQDALKMARQQIDHTHRLMSILRNRGDPDLETIGSMVEDTLRGFLLAKEDMEDLLQQLRVESKGLGVQRRVTSLWGRLKWWYCESEVESSMAKLREFQQYFAAVHLMLLER